MRKVLGIVIGWTLLACSGLPLSSSRPTDGSAEEQGEGGEPAKPGKPDVSGAWDLAENLVSGRFPSEVARDCEANAARFTFLVDRSRDDEVIRAALIAAAGCDAHVDKVALADATAPHVDDPDPRTLQAALVAADAVIAAVPVEHELVSRLLVRAYDPRPEVRYEVLAVLDRREWTTEPSIAPAFLAALKQGDAPWLVTDVLRRLRYRAKGLADPNPFRSMCTVLTTDLDPGIRGRAGLALARLAPEDEQVRTMLVYMLDDPHGFARSAAAEGLSELGWQPAIHLLMERIEDPGRNTWDMVPFTRIEGTKEVQHHVGSQFERVDDAYLRAIVALSAPLGEAAFTYRDVDPRYRDLDVISATRDAKKWYAEHKDEIPEP